MMSRHWQISSGCYFQNGRYRTNSTLSDYNYISYVGRLWCPELIPFSKWPPQYCKKSTSFNFKGSLWFIFWTCCQWPVWETSDFIILLLLLLFFSFLSLRHERVHGRSQELLDRISSNLVELSIYVLVGPKVFSFVVKGAKVIFWGVQRGWGLL